MGIGERCWIATPPRWSGLREDLRVASARDAPDYEAQGWTIEGPFTADPRGAVEDRDWLRKALTRALDGLEYDSEDERRQVWESISDDAMLDRIDGGQ